MMTTSHLCGKVQEWQGGPDLRDLCWRLSYSSKFRQTAQQLACGCVKGQGEKSYIDGWESEDLQCNPLTQLLGITELRR